MNARLATTTLIAASVALAACSKKAPEELPPAPVNTDDAGTNTGTLPQDGIGAPGSQSHFESNVGQMNTVVYFDTDQYNIDAEDTAKLQRQAQYFQQYGNVTFTVEGHADERGTREYNLALGERRANAAKNYLVSLGIPESRIRTISYGKERPVALGSDEGSWAQNRRAATVTIN
ncbi:peptidoglycan-associated lipoprotein Pal [Qipengyuania sp.]|uniref:peptidoglycan-associated lipoprotein Pal n=1 Tax=Qipengyuania sp. TaxID=2004515 RepID=UPI003735B02C